MKNPIRPGRVVPLGGGGWGYTTINHAHAEHRNPNVSFRSAFLAKQAMRKYVSNYNTARRDDD